MEQEFGITLPADAKTSETMGTLKRQVTKFLFDRPTSHHEWFLCGFLMSSTVSVLQLVHVYSMFPSLLLYMSTSWKMVHACQSAMYCINESLLNKYCILFIIISYSYCSSVIFNVAKFVVSYALFEKPFKSSRIIWRNVTSRSNFYQIVIY